MKIGCAIMETMYAFHIPIVLLCKFDFHYKCFDEIYFSRRYNLKFRIL